MGGLQLLGFSSAVRALSLTLGGLMWIRPPWCSVLYRYRPAYSGTEQRVAWIQPVGSRKGDVCCQRDEQVQPGRQSPRERACECLPHSAALPPRIRTPLAPLPTPACSCRAGPGLLCTPPSCPLPSRCPSPQADPAGPALPQGLGYVPVPHSCATLTSSE